ncbi:MAG: hypothetical protein HZA77_13415 [Candidatus Schekmanbacteria bacterium]|nr:hypothetical protein [Candidatus Schekmanbacteria bacterium]
MDKIKNCLYFFPLVFLFVAFSADAGTITVSSNSQGSGRDSTITLREAIQLSEGTLLASDLTTDEQSFISDEVGQGISDTINFNISGEGPHIIDIVSPLPNINDSGTVIDGYSQPGSSQNTVTDRTTQSDAIIMVEINGSLLAGKYSGFAVSSSNNEICGLSIHSFQDHGVYVSGTNAKNNWIWGNYIGTDSSGLTAKGNSNDGVILIDGASDNIIGTNGDGSDDIAERNIISANGNFGVDIYGAGCDRNRVSGNYIGTDVTGKNDLGNGDSGINIINGPQQNIIGTDGDGIGDGNEGNVLSGNKRGIYLRGTNSSLNIIAGNYIGVDVTGENPLGNDHAGIFISDGASGNIIGFDPVFQNGASAGNIISGNGFWGIIIADSGTDNNAVAGNYIGVSSDGTAAVGNGFGGIAIIDGPKDNIIGFADYSEGSNVISGNNGDGITISGNGTSDNKVSGNIIGTDPSGSIGIGNSGNGIIIKGGASSNQIEENKIEYNGGSGINIYSGGNILSKNLVSSNEETDIVVHDSPNDPLPPTDSPSIISASIDEDGILHIRGIADSGTKIEIFGYSSGAPENISFIGEAAPNNKGIWTFDITSSFVVGDYLLATATGPNGSSGYSEPFNITLPGLSVNIVGPSTAGRDSEITLNVYYSNSSSQTYTGVGVTVPLPEEVAFVSASDLGSLDNQSIVWEPGNIGIKGNGVLSFKVKVSGDIPDGTKITFTGYSITSTESDEVFGNDFQFILKGEADLSSSFISIEDVNGKKVNKGDTLRYKLHLVNSGSADASNFKITTFLPGTFSSYSVVSVPDGVNNESFIEAGKYVILLSGFDVPAQSEALVIIDMLLKTSLKKNKAVNLNFSLVSDESAGSGEVEAPEVKIGSIIPKGSMKIIPTDNVSIILGKTKRFKAEIKKINLKRVRWTMLEGEGTIDANKGIYKSPARAVTPKVVKVKAVSVYDPEIYKIVNIRIIPVEVKIDGPDRIKIKKGGSMKLNASVKNAKKKKIVWKVNGIKSGDSTVGKISSKGVYQMPSSPSFTSVTIRAESFADSTKYAEKKIFVKGK